MTRNVLLNNVDHADLRVAERHGSAFGDAVNQLLVFPTEFADLAREYPIFFRRGGEGTFQAVALLGLARDENLFIEGERWRARYVPAVQRRGPFLIGFQNAGDGRREPMMLVDLDDPRVGDSGGEPVFLPHGGNSPYLDGVAGALRTIHDGVEVAGAMFEAFEASGLIEPVKLEIRLSETEEVRVPDLHTISDARLAALDGVALERLNRAGFLRAAFLVAASTANVNRLIELKNRAAAAGVGP